MAKLGYLQSGVDVEKGDALVDWLLETKIESSNLKTPESYGKLMSGIGGFASIWEMGKAWRNPCLVTCTDGVGTKVKLASHFGSYEEVGQDLVAMCVNDLICTGARPLLFLDYYATGKLELENAKAFLGGIRRACEMSGCLLVGGETAEMPGVYQGQDFDCAGFAVGIVEREERLGPERVNVGDQVIGIQSHGFHSNGFSLLRKLYAEDLESHREILLRPTALYPKLFLEFKREGIPISALAHITGGGMENLPRVLPPNSMIRLNTWEFSPEFQEVQERSKLSREEMMKTFNCGWGLVAMLPSGHGDHLRQICKKEGFKTFDLGSVEARNGESCVIYT